VRESDARTSRLTWWIVRQDGREPIFGLALRLTTSAAAAKCCGRSTSFALIIWNGSSPAPSSTETTRRLAVRAGIGADPLRDVHQRVRGPEPDRVEERILDEELAAAVVGIAAVALRAREVPEAVVGRVVGALGRVDVAAVAALVGLHAARGSTAAQRRVPTPAVLAGFVILGAAPAASELVGIALVVIATAVTIATRPRR
jgi:hypothetical protein